MRIVHVTDSFAPRIGGIERQVEALARHQIADGHDVSVVTGVSTPADLPFDVVRPGVDRWTMLGSPPHQYQLARRALSVDSIDVVHAHFSLASPLAVRVARLANARRIPLAVTVHSLWPSTFIVRGANQPLGMGPIRAAWSGVSTVAAADVARVLPRSGDVMVVPNIVDTQWWQEGGPARLNDPGEVRLLVVGRLARFKRVGQLLDVLAPVRRRLRPEVALRVTIVGEGSRRPDLERKISAYGMGSWVHLLGQRTPTEIRTLLHGSDLFVAPATRESFGIAALEARSAGVPVIGRTGTGLADFIVDGKEGVLADSDDEMGAALLDLCAEPAKLVQLREVTTGSAPSLSALDAARAVDRLYDRALSPRGRRPGGSDGPGAGRTDSRAAV